MTEDRSVLVAFSILILNTPERNTFHIGGFKSTFTMASPAAVPQHTAAYIAEDKGPAIIAAICVVTALETLFCAARLYTRARIIGKLYLDDYFILASVVRFPDHCSRA